MKKFLAILLALVMVFSFVACGGDENTDEGSDVQVKVGYIFIGPINDGGFTQAMYEGAVASKEHFAGKMDFIYRENVAEDTQEVKSTALNMIDEGCNVIIACSFGFGDAMNELSGEYPDITFLHFSGAMKNDTNFDNWFGSMEQARYLTGMAAASVTESNILGYVAAHPYTEVQIGINAFTLGAQAVNPDVEVKVVYINTWGDAELEKTGAEQLLDAGADVICYHADSTAAQLAAAERDAWAIGWNYPKNDAGDKYLTAAYWNPEVYFNYALQNIMDGTFVPESYYGTMADGLIAIDEVSEAVPVEVRNQINDIKQQMIDGTFEVFTGPIYYKDGTVLCEEGQTLDRAGIWSITNEIQGVSAI
ncbi:MAG: BMP family ABC transporter substrate-binding protein [Eubacteriales Family XIII. Incertae Sedis bacterium]|nr:MAG: BMP family ABC transporter substrate-binding protein [Clostridiales Family XIII bacterium]